MKRIIGAFAGAALSISAMAQPLPPPNNYQNPVTGRTIATFYPQGAQIGSQTAYGGVRTWLYVVPVEGDVIAAAPVFGGSMTVSAWALAPSTSVADYVNPSGSWINGTFNAGGVCSSALNPTGSGARSFVISATFTSPDTGATGVFYPTCGDLLSFPSTAPASGNIRFLFLRVTLPNAASYVMPYLAPNWLNGGTSGAAWQTNQSGYWTANATINRGRDFSVLAYSGDAATTPGAIALASVGPLGGGPLLGVRFLMANRTMVVQSDGDSVACGQTTSGAMNTYAVQSAAAISTPANPVQVMQTCVGGATYLQYGQQTLFQMGKGRAPSVMLIQGFSRNGWDGTALGWAKQMGYVEQAIQRAREQGAVPLVTTGVPVGTASLSVYNSTVYPALMALTRIGAATVIDTASAVGAKSAGAFTGAYLAGLSDDGTHPNDAGHAAMAGPLTPVLAALAANAR